jgi:hypothetical protein
VDPAVLEALLLPGDWPGLADLIHGPEWMRDAACGEHPDPRVGPEPLHRGEVAHRTGVGHS